MNCLKYLLSILLILAVTVNQQLSSQDIEDSSEDTHTVKEQFTVWWQSVSETVNSGYQKSKVEANKLVDQVSQQTGKVITPQKRQEIVEALSSSSQKTYSYGEKLLHSLLDEDEDCPTAQS